MIYLALIIPVIAGFVLVQLIKPNSKHLQLFLSFSGAYLLSVTVLHLIPEVFSNQQEHIGLFILLGIVIQTGLEYLSKGAEHGHIHKHDFEKRIPWVILISLCLHSFLEGMPLALGENQNLLYAIVIHKLPVTIILAVFTWEFAFSFSFLPFDCASIVAQEKTMSEQNISVRKFFIFDWFIF